MRFEANPSNAQRVVGIASTYAAEHPSESVEVHFAVGHYYDSDLAGHDFQASTGLTFIGSGRHSVIRLGSRPSPYQWVGRNLIMAPTFWLFWRRRRLLGVWGPKARWERRVEAVAWLLAGEPRLASASWRGVSPASLDRPWPRWRRQAGLS